jgi:hypothetical protein
MDKLQKSLDAVDKLLKEKGREYVNMIFNEVQLLDIDGPMIEDYFKLCDTVQKNKS